jgi:aryl-alcohol dehydrogenase-like predicted oxidoreductase
MTETKKRMTRKEFLRTSAYTFLGLNALGFRKNLKKGRAFGKAAPESKTLGRTGIRVSSMGFGASRTMEPALVGAALDAGMNFLDTGRSYSRGQNEVMVGEVIASRRKDVVIQSKLRVTVREEEGGLSSAEAVKKVTDRMAASMQASLEALKTDYIDIMLIHGATSPEVVYHEAVVRFFESAKKNGTIRAHGFSSHSNQIELMRASNRNPFYDVIMVPYNHKGSYIHSQSNYFAEWDQPALEAEMKKAKELGVGLVAMKTCSAGTLAPDPSGEPSFAHALRWILNQDMVHTMAVAMGNFSQIEENLQAFA